MKADPGAASTSTEPSRGRAARGGPDGAAFRAHVLKITHHGSADGTGRPLVRAVRPRIAVASSAADDGHRLEPAVKRRLREEMGRVQIRDTATEAGDLVVRTDGRRRQAGLRSGVWYEVARRGPSWAKGRA